MTKIAIDAPAASKPRDIAMKDDLVFMLRYLNWNPPTVKANVKAETKTKGKLKAQGLKGIGNTKKV
ncbi:MAG: hypothetical protein KGM95_05260 [Betaproteobacteria bacterium]|nr:hypothetical protein [Betaproteobacteria bacterium]